MKRKRSDLGIKRNGPPILPIPSTADTSGTFTSVTTVNQTVSGLSTVENLNVTGASIVETQTVEVQSVEQQTVQIQGVLSQSVVNQTVTGTQEVGGTATFGSTVTAQNLNCLNQTNLEDVTVAGVINAGTIEGNPDIVLELSTVEFGDGNLFVQGEGVCYMPRVRCTTLSGMLENGAGGPLEIIAENEITMTCPEINIPNTLYASTLNVTNLNVSGNTTGLPNGSVSPLFTSATTTTEITTNSQQNAGSSGGYGSIKLSSTGVQLYDGDNGATPAFSANAGANTLNGDTTVNGSVIAGGQVVAGNFRATGGVGGGSYYGTSNDDVCFSSADVNLVSSFQAGQPFIRMQGNNGSPNQAKIEMWDGTQSLGAPLVTANYGVFTVAGQVRTASTYSTSGDTVLLSTNGNTSTGIVGAASIEIDSSLNRVSIWDGSGGSTVPTIRMQDGTMYSQGATYGYLQDGGYGGLQSSPNFLWDLTGPDGIAYYSGGIAPYTSTEISPGVPNYALCEGFKITTPGLYKISAGSAMQGAGDYIQITVNGTEYCRTAPTSSGLYIQGSFAFLASANDIVRAKSSGVAGLQNHWLHVEKLPGATNAYKRASGAVTPFTYI